MLRFGFFLLAGSVALYCMGMVVARSRIRRSIQKMKDGPHKTWGVKIIDFDEHRNDTH